MLALLYFFYNSLTNKPICFYHSNIIENIDELYVIGYSFGDEHINNRIIKAMYLNPNMKMWIVDPNTNKWDI